MQVCFSLKWRVLHDARCINFLSKRASLKWRNIGDRIVEIERSQGRKRYLSSRCSWPKVVATRTMQYIYARKEGINRDNSRLGVFEMTAIRNTSLIPPLALDSLLQTLRRSTRQTPQRGNFTRAPVLCICEKSQPTANHVTPFMPHFSIRKGDSERQRLLCDQLSVSRAEIWRRRWSTLWRL